jgi:type VI protein secretion system component Hcp
MRKRVMVFVICLITMISFTGVVNSHDSILPIKSLSLSSTAPRPSIPMDPNNESEDDESTLIAPAEQKIYMRDKRGYYTDSNNMDPIHRGELQILSYSLVAGKATGGTAGNNFLKITKRLDSASTKILRDCIKGTHVLTFSLKVYKSRDPEEKLLEITFQDILFSSYNIITDNEDPENTIEEICITYSRMTFEQTLYKNDGTPSGTTKFDYDFKTGRSY